MNYARSFLDRLDGLKLILLDSLGLLILSLSAVLPLHALTNQRDFTDSTDFTFDSNEIEFGDGQALLKRRNSPIWYNENWTKRKAVTV